MKIKVKIAQEINAKFVKVFIPIRYGDEDIPYDFPLRCKDIWVGIIDIDQGRIIDWPNGESGRLFAKVCDEGEYTLLDEGMSEIIKIKDYAPNNLIPGEYGDYVDLHIDEIGMITNWNGNANLVDFFDYEDLVDD